MMPIDDIIDYEPEQTGLDFKAIQYKKEQFFELLKDIIAMANSDLSQDGLIITGVKKNPDNSFTVSPIPNGELTDSAIYQKLVDDNIEPDLHIDYTSHLYKGIELVGVLRIAKGTNKPYMMKKDFSSGTTGVRKKGESFIRRGTTTSPLMRKDIDRIFEQRKQQDAFTHPVFFYFSGTNKQKVIELHPTSGALLPSRKQAQKIQAILDKREEEARAKIEAEREKPILKELPPAFTDIVSSLNRPVTGFNFPPIFGDDSLPYEKRQTQTLKEDLKEIQKTYLEDDMYVLFEELSEKINISVLNEGTKYLEDATIKIQIAETPDIMIADKIYEEPEEPTSMFRARLPKIASWETLNYSHFERIEGHCVYSVGLGDLRHLQPKDVFRVPLRIVLFPSSAGKDIEIKLTLYGKNLIKPIEDMLLIKVKT